MKNVIKNIKTWPVLVLVVALVVILMPSCQKEWDEHYARPENIEGKILEQLKADPDYSIFVEALARTRVDQLIGNSGIYTVFAPTNQAFQNYFATSNYKSIQEIPILELENLLNYHISTAMLFSFDYKAIKDKKVQIFNKGTTRFESRLGKTGQVAGKSVTVIADETSFKVNDATVVKPDIAAANGAIHGIDKVLIPLPNIDEALAQKDNLSIFHEAVKRFQIKIYSPELSYEDPTTGVIDSVFYKISRLVNQNAKARPEANIASEATLLTVFVPTNEAFNEFLAKYPQYNSLADVPDNVLEILVSYHILYNQNKLASQLSGAQTTISKEKVTVTLSDIVSADNVQSNGVYHVINKVLVPPSLGTVGGKVLLNTDKDLSSFLTALEKTGLLTELFKTGKDDKYTVFAPTNQAFINAGLDVSKMSGAALNDYVRAHIVKGTYKKADLKEGRYFGTIGTGGLKSTLSGGLAVINYNNKRANITATDITASNGVIHKVDNVLSGPTDPVLDLLQAESQYTEFVAALEKAGLTLTSAVASEGLNGGGPYTILAPTNMAFNSLYAELGVVGLSQLSREQLKPILLYHTIASRVYSSDFAANKKFKTRSSNREVITNVSPLRVTDLKGRTAIVVSSDKQGSNGIIHTLDKVLLPQ